MDGFPLVLLGITLFAIAYAMLKIQRKMQEVTKAIDAGFKTIEDGVTQNLLGSQGAITKSTTALITLSLPLIITRLLTLTVITGHYQT